MCHGGLYFVELFYESGIYTDGHRLGVNDRLNSECDFLDALPTDMHMVGISWRVRYTDNSVTSHFAVFDINRWYHAQMPKKIWYENE